MKNFFLSLKKWFLLGILIIFFCLFSYFDLYRYLNFDTLMRYHNEAAAWTTQHNIYAATIYLLVFIVLVACGIPCATILTLLGGFLFGAIAFLYAMLGTLLGGLILFLAIRTAIGEKIASKSRGWIKSMEAGFHQNAFQYLLMLRLIPVFPCGLSNIAAGALNVPIKTYLLATSIGIMPATFIYAMLGRGLDTLFSNQNGSDSSLLLRPSLFFPLLGLAILSFFPIIYKSVKKTKQNR